MGVKYFFFTSVRDLWSFRSTINSHRFSSSSYPSTEGNLYGFLFFPDFDYFWSPSPFASMSPLNCLNKESTLSDSMSSTKRGSYICKMLELSSKQGLVFTSIIQVLRSSSMIKSYPKSSKQCFLFIGSIKSFVAKIDRVIYFFIVGMKLSLTEY